MHDPDPLSAAIARRLRALPGDAPEPYGWEEFKRRAARREASAPDHGLRASAARAYRAVYGASSPERGAARWMGISARGMGISARGVGIAAAALLLVAGLGLTVRMRSGPLPRTARIPLALTARSASAPAGMQAGAVERTPFTPRTEPALVRVGAYAAVADLEDQIAQIDEVWAAARARGARPASLSALEAQRARLVTSLAQVRFAEAVVAQSEPIH